MAHTVSGGSTKNGRESSAKRLGVKLYAGEPVKAGMIIIRQRGQRYLAGTNVRRGKDDTLYAASDGIIAFGTMRKARFDGSSRTATVVAVRSR